MTRSELEALVLSFLRDFCHEDPSRIESEVNTYGDAEVASIFFIEILGFLEEELGIRIPEVSIHNEVKSSFRQYCDLLESIIAKGGG